MRMFGKIKMVPCLVSAFPHQHRRRGGELGGLLVLLLLEEEVRGGGQLDLVMAVEAPAEVTEEAVEAGEGLPGFKDSIVDCT